MQVRLTQEYLQWVSEHTRMAKEQAAMLQTGNLPALWDFFKNCEAAFLAACHGTAQADADAEASEFGLTLFAMNHLVDTGATDFFRLLGLPQSTIIPEMWEPGVNSIISRAIIGEGIVGKNGTLYADVPYAQLDPHWSMASITYFFKEIGILKTHSFETPGSFIRDFENQENLTIAIIGDWGTGNWRDCNYKAPAMLVAEAIGNLSPQPDITIHLGDVYYCGLHYEEKRNLLPHFPKAKSGYNFTLNSNHETYDGANGYFEAALTDQLFKHQGNKSYFAISLKDWMIIGLDSSFYDKSIMVMYGAITNGMNSHQQDFIKTLNISPDQKILLLTHHPGLNYDGKQINDPLVSQVHKALGGIYPDYWYYGHTHNGFVYNDKSAIGDSQFQTRYKTYPRLRCVGHSSIPFGKADIDGGNAGLDYYSHEPVPFPVKRQKLRLLNGFALLTLSGQSIQEQFYAVSPTDGAKIEWHN